MTFPENRELLAGIIAHAEEDAPRLVYADWLEEHGDPHLAEFIRVQCALAAGSPAEPDHAEWLERKAAVLPHLGRRRLEPELPDAVSFYHNLEEEDDTYDSYYRGLPYFAHEPDDMDDEVVAAQRFRDALPEVMATTTLRGVKFHGRFSRQLATILSSPAAGQLSAISAFNSAASVPTRDSLAVQAIVASAAASSVRWLDLDHVDAKADLDTLARTKALGQLQRLHVRWLGGDSAALQRLFAASWFGRLRRVAIGIGAEHGARNAASTIAALSRLPDLHSLTLYDLPAESLATFASGNPLGSLGKLFTRGSPFANLGKLHLRDTSLQGQGAATLSSARFPRLVDLRLQRCKLGDAEWKALYQAQWFANLRVLDLSGNRIGDQALARLAASPVAAKLRVLYLEDHNLGKPGLAALARAGNFAGLTTLSLPSEIKMQPADLAWFLSQAQLPQLRHLRLQMQPVDDAGAQALAGNASFANLRTLNLGYGKIGPAGGKALFASPHLKNLVQLSLIANPMQGKVNALADPRVLPQLAECWLPDDVPHTLKSKLNAGRDTWFIG